MRASFLIAKDILVDLKNNFPDAGFTVTSKPYREGTKVYVDFNIMCAEKVSYDKVKALASKYICAGHHFLHISK